MKAFSLFFGLSLLLLGQSALGSGWCIDGPYCKGQSFYVTDKNLCTLNDSVQSFLDSTGECQAFDPTSKTSTSLAYHSACVMPGMMCESIMDICCTTGNYCGGSLMCH